MRLEGGGSMPVLDSRLEVLCSRLEAFLGGGLLRYSSGLLLRFRLRLYRRTRLRPLNPFGGRFSPDKIKIFTPFPFLLVLVSAFVPVFVCLVSFSLPSSYSSFQMTPLKP